MKNKYYLSLIVVMGLSVTNVAATVFTPLASDIKESANIYNANTTMLRVDAKTVIGQGPCVVGNYSGCTMTDVNNDIDGTDDFKPEVKIHFTSDDFADDGQPTNATICLRGNTSRYVDLKSYRLKLDSKKKLWRGQRKLQLNKHLGDLTRIKNKLSFDLMSTVPHLPSLRTQFVHFYIDNEDFGLFTHVENVGKEYLKRRGYDKDSNLYKAESFDFRLYPELEIDADGQPVDLKAFESIIEIKRGKDSKKFIEMMKALNSYDNDFKKDVLDKYFNVNNVITWEAINILMGNSDIRTSNFYLFNPKGKDTFYFLPWDYDQSWGYDWEEPTIRQGFVPPKSYRGPHNFWATKFGQRFLSQPNGLALLKGAVDEIKDNYFSEDKIKAFLTKYHDLVMPILSQNPDFDYFDFNKPTDAETLVEYNKIYDALSSAVERNYQQFLKDLNSPMPFWTDEPITTGKNITFSWDESVDLQGDNVTYDLEISTSENFDPADIMYVKKNIAGSSFTTKWMLPKGDYFFRITARDSTNPTQNWQYSFDEYYNEQTDMNVFGVKSFYVNFNGGGQPKTITIDGEQNDWVGKLIFTDANDIVATDVVDWRKGGFVQDADNFYLAYINDDDINTDNFWAWHVFINVDNNAATGFDDGYEYMLEGNELWKYTGDGESWSWEKVIDVENNINGNFVEFSIPKRLLSNSNVYEVFFYGSNKYIKAGTPSDYMIGN